MSVYRHYPLALIRPDFDDPLTDLIIELDHQRAYVLAGTTPPEMFFQLKRLFHILESLGSARIENNRTTVAQIVDREIDGTGGEDSQFREILNIEKAMDFIESFVSGSREGTAVVDHSFIRHVHATVSEGLSASGEGDMTPGEYRKSSVRIAGAAHFPPPAGDVYPLMGELIDFLGRREAPKYDLIKIALAHHRFAWIHPFSNGNGRTVRLLTYALLLGAGFRVGGMGRVSRLLNPTAVFCSDRKKYYDGLAAADSGGREGLLSWCRYVLGGLREELRKVERLLDYDYLRKEIMRPALGELRRKNGLSDHEYKILLFALDRQPFRNADVKPILGKLGQVQVSRILAGLRDRRLLLPYEGAARKYVVGMEKSPLLREVMRRLDAEGFLPLRGEI